MTKAEELKILEQIERLIAESGADSYIAMTFAGVPEICKQNIENDFGDTPVRDWKEMRNMLGAERVAHDETKRQLADAQKYCNETLDALSAESLKLEEQRKLTAEWEQNAHDAVEMYCGLEAECAELSAEIRKLKAEIVRMRYERMTEDDMARWYDIEKMNEE